MLYTIAAHPVAASALDLAQHAEVRTKGPVAVFAVVLMFGALCGGVFMLLQSNFGAKVGYLITGTAFWGCWFVLALLWMTGVPGLNMPGPVPDIPESTLKNLGPQGDAAAWVPVTAANRTQHPAPDNFITVTAEATDERLQGEVTAAQTAATEPIQKYYAEKLGVGVDDITLPGIVKITRVEISRHARQASYARLHTAAAEPGPTVTDRQRDILGRIQPATFDLYFDAGSVATPTYIALGLFLVLFAAHAALLATTDRPAPAHPHAAPERERVSA